MQPVVREVYNDLKSITPGNTIMNNAMGAQMGLPADNLGNMPPQNAMPGGMPGNQNGMFTCPMHGNTPMPRTRFGNAGMNNPNFAQMNHPNPQQGMGQMGQDMGHIDPGSGQMGQPGKEMAHTGPIGHEMGQMGQEMGHMGHGMVQPGQGMGHMGHGMVQPGQRMGHMGQEMGQTGQGMGNMGMANSGGMMAGMGPQIVNMMASARKNNMPNQGGPPPNSTGDMPPPHDMGQMAPNMHGDANPGHYHHGHMHNHAGHMEMTQGDPRMQPNPHMSQPNAFPGAPPNVQGNAMPGNMNRVGPPSQQMGNMNPNPNPYGQHGAGMAKFNQMFPGVMKGDLGFDPMAIAIQMNPANQQKNAMDTMQKMLMNNANTAGISRIMDTTGKASSMMQPVINATNAAAASIAQPNQQMPNQAPGQQNIPQQQSPGGAPMQNQMPQQVYTALTPAPTMEQQQIPPQQMTPHEQQQWQQQQPPPDQSQRLEAVHSNALPTVYEGSGDPNARQQQPPVAERIYREPILPADTSRNLLHSHHFLKPQRFFDYNTLGQPVEMTPIRHPTELPNQPQTLSPQPAPNRFSNVKSTVSKTALMGNRPVGRTPSRSQLQQVYNQYKGSQSYTQQNIRPSARNGSFSEGHINIPQGNLPPQPPIENIERNGGDTAANNQMRQMDQVGDVPAGKKLPEDYAMVSIDKSLLLLLKSYRKPRLIEVNYYLLLDLDISTIYCRHA